MSDKREIEVVEIASGEVVKRIDVSTKSERGIEKVMRGLLMQMDTNRYYLRCPT